jgi:2-polyprenyl-3-methyl-5-hydroxy-6-metoxy-1,4-benzoquinol methylase
VTGTTFPQDLRILDYGMGLGLFARAMVACGCQVWGFDLAAGRQSAAAASGVSTIRYEDIREMFGNTLFRFVRASAPTASRG